MSAPRALRKSLPPTAPPPALRHVFRWDLDKTYLQTDFDGVRALIRTAREKASQKRSVPGAAALLRELRAAGPAGAHRICFVSGSPRQMRTVLTEKLRLDGVEFDEFILKPNLSNLLRGRFRMMREQVHYKLPALLAGRGDVPPDVPETLFGDDAESDAVIYSLYADLLAGVATADDLAGWLKRTKLYPDDQERLVEMARNIRVGAAVRHIFILLDRRSPPARFDPFGERLVPVYNYFQAALSLVSQGLLGEPAALRVALAMVSDFDYAVEALANSVADLVRRGRVTASLLEGTAHAFAEGLSSLDTAQVVRERLLALPERLYEACRTRVVHPPAPVAIDYAFWLAQGRNESHK